MRASQLRDLEEGPISAVIAEDRGEFTTHTLLVTGNRLQLNFATRGSAGSVRVEVLGQDHPGLTTPPLLSGDELAKEVSWR